MGGVCFLRRKSYEENSKDAHLAERKVMFCIPPGREEGASRAFFVHKQEKRKVI